MRRLQLFSVGLMLSLASIAQNFSNYYFEIKDVSGDTKTKYFTSFQKATFGKDALIFDDGTQYDYTNGLTFLHLDLKEYQGEHDFDENGYCRYPDSGVETPALVTAENYGKLGLSSEDIGSYAISKAGHMFWLAQQVNSGRNTKGRYVLINDIDMTEHTSTAEGVASHTYKWDPIGNETHYFEGEFDGRNHNISNFTYALTLLDGENKNQKTHGLFGSVFSGTIKNFTIDGTIYSSKTVYEPIDASEHDYAYVGLIGLMPDGVVENVHSSITINFPNVKVKHIGGMIGSIGDDSNSLIQKKGIGYVTVNACSYHGTMELPYSTNAIGGIIGHAGDKGLDSYNLTVTNCLFDGTINTRPNNQGFKWYIFGGIIGYFTHHIVFQNNLYLGHITNASYTGGNDHVGALVGRYKNGNAIASPMMASNNYYGTLTHSNLKLVGVWDSSDKTDAQNIFKNSAKLTTEEELKNGTTVTKLGSFWRGIVKEGYNNNYPSPYIASHTHTYGLNGFCTICKNECQPATIITESNKASYELGSEYVGYYAIANAGNMYWWAEHVNNVDNKSKAVLVTDILDLEGNSHIWETIGHNIVNPFEGVFDGREKKIINFHQLTSSNIGGMFGYVHAATIKSFEIEGNLKYCYAYKNNPYFGLISYVGYQESESSNPTTTLIQDIYSKLTINIPKAGAQSYTGGIVAFMDASAHIANIDRCRFSGTINVQQNNRASGGIAGTAGLNHCITNCLFEGTITVDGEKSGGIIGLVLTEGSSNTIHFNGMKNCLSVGKVTKVNNYGLLSGSISQEQDSKYNINNYYREDATLINGDGSVNKWHYAPIKLRSELLASDKLMYWLGADNWVKVEGTDYPIPCYKSSFVKDICTHESHYNGFCDKCGMHYEEPELITIDNFRELNVSHRYIGYYAIGNGGHMYWFADKVNAGNTKINAVLVSDNIDMGGDEHIWHGIGRLKATVYEKSIRYEGVFDGQGKTLRNFFMHGIEHYSGLFSYVGNKDDKLESRNAQVFNFTLEGTQYLSSYREYTGTVFGYVLNHPDIYSITSKIDVKVNGNTTAYAGGIAGVMKDANLDRCRYSGTMTIGGSTNMFGGICARIQNTCNITNCLFDGTITGTSTSTDVRAGGIVAYKENDCYSSIENCLVQGSIIFEKSTSARINVFLGYFNSNKDVKIINSYYKADNKYKKENTALGLAGALSDASKTGTVEIDAATREVSDAELADKTILNLLGTKKWMQETPAMLWPVPSIHVHNYINGFCTLDDCNVPYEQPINDAANHYIISNGGNLYWFANHVNKGGTNVSTNATLENDIDLEGFDSKGKDKRLWTPIGKYNGNEQSSTYGYKGIFDGAAHTISGLNLQNHSDNVSGLFGFVETGTVKRFTVTGKISSDFGGKTHIGVIGRMSGGLSQATASNIEDITSEVDITIGSKCNQNYVGGVVGIGWYDQKAQRYTVINRCRFCGTITSNATTNTYIGGIIALSRPNELIYNCLFDGKINIKGTGKSTGNIAGICGGTDSNDKIRAIQNCLSVGTITGGAVKGAIINTCTNASTENSFNNYYANSMGLNPDGNTSMIWNEAPVAVNSTQLASGDIVYKLGTENWTQVLTGDDKWAYPMPLIGSMSELPEISGDEHTNFTNGFCSLCHSYFQKPEEVGGAIIIRNAGNLFWYSKQLRKDNTLAVKNIIIQPEDDEGNPIDHIDLEYIVDKSNPDYGTSRHGNTFIPIGTPGVPYEGVFNGQGKTIRNFYLSTVQSETGFIGVVHKGTVKDLTVKGAIDIKTLAVNHVGLIGMMGQGNIEGVHSAINITTGSNLVCKHIGGVLGSTNSSSMTPNKDEGAATIDRSRYSGTMSLGKSCDCLGGIVGYANGDEKITNCLFDGSITTSGKSNCYLGGILGYTSDVTTQAHNNLSIGTLKAGSYAYVGAIIGRINVNINNQNSILLNNYHNRNNARALGAAGGYACNMQFFALGDSHIASGVMAYQLGCDNWTMITEGENACDHPVPVMAGSAKLSACTSHTYNPNGFCTECGAYESVVKISNKKYTIANGGQFYDFARKYNAKKIDQAAEILLLKDIDLEGDAHPWEGIGIVYPTYDFMGTFDGQGYAINNFFCSNSHDFANMFVRLKNSTIRNFTVNGEMYLTLNARYSSPIAGWMGSTVIEGITSNVNINVHKNATPEAVGGIASCSSSGTINRCRYKGTMTLNGAYNKIGGICAHAATINITNCLYDGQMVGTSNNANLWAGGILGNKDSNADIKIGNCFVKGTILFTKSACANNKLGLFLGYGSFDNNTIAIDNCHYTPDGKENANGELTKAYGSLNSATSGKITVDASAVGTEEMSNGVLLRSLGTGQWWQKHTNGVATEPYPIPFLSGECTSYTGDFCQFCGMSNDGIFHICNPIDLACFRNTVNFTDREYKAVVENDIDLSSYKNGVFGDPIGIASMPFKGTFDGKGHTISNLNINIGYSTANIGFFGNIQKATINNFTLEGSIKSTKNCNNLYIGLVGNVDLKNLINNDVLIKDVHSRLNISTPNQTQAIAVGGIVGRAANRSSSTLTIEQCSFIGTLDSGEGNLYHGGIIGLATNGYQLIQNCLVKADITTSHKGGSEINIGGIVGRTDSDNFDGIKNCLWIGGSLTAPYATGIKNIGTIVASDTQTKPSDKDRYTNNYVYNFGELAISNREKINAATTKITIVGDLKSGKVCALLNTGINASNPVWGQLLGNVPEAEEYPTPCLKNFVTKDASNNYKADKYILSAGGGELILPDFTSSANKCVEAKSLDVSATFVNDGWLPLYAPLRLNYDSWKEDFEVAKIMNFQHYFKKATEKYPDGRDIVILEVQKVTQGTLKENWPYLIRAKNNTGANVLTLSMNESNTANGQNRSVFEMNGNNTINCASTENIYVFKGNYSNEFTFPSKTHTSDEYYVLRQDGEFKAMTLIDDATLANSSTHKDLVPMCTWYMTQSSREYNAGDKQYYAPKRIYICFPGDNIDDLLNEEEATDIEDIANAEAYPIAYVTSDGTSHTTPQAGRMNIVKMSNGTIQKIFVK